MWFEHLGQTSALIVYLVESARQTMSNLHTSGMIKTLAVIEHGVIIEPVTTGALRIGPVVLPVHPRKYLKRYGF